MEEVTISLTEGTVKKLRAYAMLSGQNAPGIMANIGNFLDAYFTQQISEILGIDLTPQTASYKVSYEAPAKVAVPEATESEHSLSEDNMEDAVESAEDRSQKERITDLSDEEDDLGFNPDVLKVRAPKTKDVGDNAEAFLQAVIDNDTRPGQGGIKGRHVSGARKYFDAKKPRVRISNATLDEEDAPETLF